MYTKQHFEDFAKILSGAREYSDAYDGIGFIEDEMLELFSQSNPRFNEEKFRKAVHDES